MDIALLSANANQLRHALELCAPYRTLLIVLFSLSILLQVVPPPYSPLKGSPARRGTMSCVTGISLLRI